MDLQGKIYAIGQTKQVSEKFKIREFVIETPDPTYPQHILLQFTKDKCSILDNYAIGDYVNVQFNLNGRKWTNPEGKVKFFNTLQAWKIEKTSQSAPVDDGNDFQF